jgi:hypothetical protein
LSSFFDAIVSEGKKLPAGDETMQVRVIKTGGELDSKLADVLDNPKER